MRSRLISALGIRGPFPDKPKSRCGRVDSAIVCVLKGAEFESAPGQVFCFFCKLFFRFFFASDSMSIVTNMSRASERDAGRAKRDRVSRREH